MLCERPLSARAHTRVTLCHIRHSRLSVVVSPEGRAAAGLLHGWSHGLCARPSISPSLGETLTPSWREGAIGTQEVGEVTASGRGRRTVVLWAAEREDSEVSVYEAGLQHSQPSQSLYLSPGLAGAMCAQSCR